jgi:hypothetical protein
MLDFIKKYSLVLSILFLLVPTSVGAEVSVPSAQYFRSENVRTLTCCAEFNAFSKGDVSLDFNRGTVVGGWDGVDYFESASINDNTILLVTNDVMGCLPMESLLFETQWSAKECKAGLGDKEVKILIESNPEGPFKNFLSKNYSLVKLDTEQLYQQEVNCHLYPTCFHSLPFVSSEFVDWKVYGSYEVSVGETVGLEVVASTTVSGANVTQVACIDNSCGSGLRLDHAEDTDDGRGKIAYFDFDSIEYMEKHKNEFTGFPVQVELEVYATLTNNADSSAKLFSVFVIGLTIDSVDCRNTYRNQPNCNTKNPKYCFWNVDQCESRYDSGICRDVAKNLCGTLETSGKNQGTSETACVYHDKLKCIPSLTGAIVADYGVPEGYKGPLPDCAFYGQCKDVNKLVLLFIKLGQNMLGIVGVFAFAVLVYGGFLTLTSFGNAERVKSGQQAILAAVIGLIVSASAYLLVTEILDVLGANSGITGIF